MAASSPSPCDLLHAQSTSIGGTPCSTTSFFLANDAQHAYGHDHCANYLLLIKSTPNLHSPPFPRSSGPCVATARDTTVHLSGTPKFPRCTSSLLLLMRSVSRIARVRVIENMNADLRARPGLDALRFQHSVNLRSTRRMGCTVVWRPHLVSGCLYHHDCTPGKTLYN